MTRAAQQFVTLDALRGVAAIGVMAFHAPGNTVLPMPGGFLAVDLFFMMSGFVLAQAYRSRLAEGLSSREFLWRRAIRLWPMLAVGALLGIVLHGGHAGSLLLLPDPRGSNLFPANPPLWSLLFETLAYIAFVLGLWRLRPLALAAVVGVSGATLVWMTITQAPLADIGPHWQTVGGGFARIGYGFAGGMLAWHLWAKRSAPPRRSWLGWLPLAGMAAISAGIAPDDGPLVLFALFAGCPVILWAALRWDLPQPRVARGLGDLSYPLYCIHVPLIAWMLASGWHVAAIFAALPVAALALHRAVDIPVRRWLGRVVVERISPSRSTLPTSAQDEQELGKGLGIG